MQTSQGLAHAPGSKPVTRVQSHCSPHKAVNLPTTPPGVPQAATRHNTNLIKQHSHHRQQGWGQQGILPPAARYPAHHRPPQAEQGSSTHPCPQLVPTPEDLSQPAGGQIGWQTGRRLGQSEIVSQPGWCCRLTRVAVRLGLGQRARLPERPHPLVRAGHPERIHQQHGKPKLSMVSSDWL